MQAVDENAPIMIEKKPVPQAVHEADPAALWYRPDEQTSQLSAPDDENCPAAQLWQLSDDTAPASDEYRPAAQLWQLWSLEYWPFGHVFEQDDDPEEENVPISQRAHTSAAAAEYVFEAHDEQLVAPAALKVPAMH